LQSFRVAKVMGIPIELHITFVLLLLVVFYFWGVEGLILYIFLFTSVVLHELGHSYVAKKYGITIEKILLLPIGGVAMMGQISKEGEFKIAIAGPLVSLTLGGLFLILSSFMDINMGNYPLFQTVGVLNIMLGIFNLLPAFPMDGGRVFRALMSKKYSYLKATKIASTVGQFLSLMLLVLGLLSLNVILVLIALFIYYGASQEYRVLLMDEMFRNIKAKDIMSKDVVHVSPDMTVEEFINTLINYRYMGYPVIKNGKILGTITFADITNADKNEKIENLMKPPVIISKDSDISELLYTMDSADRVYVMDNGELEGIISKTDLVRTLKILGLKNSQ